MELNQNLHQLFARLFAGIDEKQIRQIFDSGRQFELKTGEYLFHQGEEDKAIYIVLKGRLRAISEQEQSKKILGDIGAGETVGEFAFFSDEARMASVLAIRESAILEFTPDKFMKLLSSNTELATLIFKLVFKRIQRNAFEISKASPPKNIALLNLQKTNALSHIIEGIEAYFEHQGEAVQVYDAISFDKQDYDQVFNALENHEGINFLLCDDEHQSWSKHALIYADLIIVTSDFEADQAIYPLEKEFRLYEQNILNKKVYLLLLHPEKSDVPQNTNLWLNERPVDLHIHIRQHNTADIDRLCRIISNKATGLVLGGGGAKGFAHIGAVQALMEAGITIDFLGGSSAGALYGIGMSFADFNFDKIHTLNKEGVSRKMTSGDYALPFISMKQGKKFKAYLKKIFINRHMEDIWVNSYCISANLSGAKMHRHISGPIWKQVLASMAIPGIYPPVVIDNHLHVDGGVMDNLPIESIYKYPVNTVIAISLSSLKVKEVSYEDLPGSLELFFDKVLSRKKYKIPGIASLIINAMTINSMRKQVSAKEGVSHYIELDLEGVKLIDDSAWKDTIQKGYDQTRKYLMEKMIINDK